jgi:ABC-type uncharacterized transport system substrate-binding protein
MLSASADPANPICFYVNSYHKGDTWSDEIEHSLRNSIANKCTLVQHDMDSLQHETRQDAELAGRAAFEMMKIVEPDVVITSDDTAAKYFVMPYVKNSAVPVVFSGINWTVEEYGFPADNVTGIIEVAPIKPMLLQALKLIGKHRSAGNRIVYLGADSPNDIKNFNVFREAALRMGLVADAILVSNFDTWQYGFEVSQDYDLIILGDNTGIDGWNNRQAVRTAISHSRKLSLTNNYWMMPYTAIGYTKIAAEQGEWAAATALAIIDGMKASEIPLVTNTRWDIWVNDALRTAMQIEVSQELKQNAKIYQ